MVNDRFWLTLLLLLAPLPARGQSRFEQLTQRFQNSPEQARVLCASYLGSSGTEWLVSGGFQPDGAIVLVGCTLGPTFEFPPTPVTVLGRDGSAPEPYSPEPQKDKSGKPVLTKDGRPKYVDPSWKHASGTAFVVRLDATAKKVVSASRFPWKSAGVTAAVVDADGAIYLAGPAREGIATVSCTDRAELKPLANAPDKGATPMVYLAKLSATADRVLWLRTLASPANAPEVEIDRAGKIRFSSADLRVFDRQGKLERVVAVPGGLGRTTAVHPETGIIVKGGERHWPTGREPYRDPKLDIYRPDGKLLYELYHWDGPLVGLDNLRLVSDSAIRLLRFDDHGDLLLYAWSDGGNSVMYREPYDVRTFSKKMDGLKMSAYGANVLSCAYLIRLDSQTYQVKGGTLWLAYLKDKDKPNSITVDTLGLGPDGSVCIAGNSAWGLIRTGNAIGGGEPAGPYITVMTPDCTSLRFSSDMPACAKADLKDGSKWGIVRGTVQGKHRVLYLTAAIATEENYGKTLTAPTVNALQPKHAGGHLDGHFTLLEWPAK